MTSINAGRVLIGGIVAGIVDNAASYGVQSMMKVENDAMVSRLNLDRAIVEGSASMTTWIIVGFVFGFLVVFTYAAMRPRFGAGPKTAIIAGVVLWAAITAVLAGFSSMGVIVQAAFIKMSALHLVGSVAAALAGAAVYKE